MRLNPTASLRRQLIARLLWPMLLLLGVAGILTYSIALYFANLAYDRWLFDSARALTQQVQFIGGSPQVMLPESAVQIFEWDDLDRIYYSITNQSGKPVFGRANFPAPPVQLEPGAPPVYYNARIDGIQIRVVALRLPSRFGNEEVTIRVGETLVKRRVLAKEILLAIFGFQALVVGAAVALIWGGIKVSLHPLESLALAIAGRTAEDLGPLGEDVPHEILPLVHSLNALLARLRNALLAQKRFIADASHQLRTPLSALQVQAERALREQNPEAHAEALRRVVSSIGRVTHVAHQLLMLASADPESQEHHRLTPLDLARLARETAIEWVPTALSRQIDLGYTGAETGVPILGEAQMLKELLGNLIDNALQYSGPGSRVTVGVAADAHSAALYVEDNGPGIPLDARVKVFERFFRLSDSGGRGCGLGLAIVKEIAQTHRATVRAETGSEGIGTCIRVEFPVAASAQPSIAQGEGVVHG